MKQIWHKTDKLPEENKLIIVAKESHEYIFVGKYKKIKNIPQNKYYDYVLIDSCEMGGCTDLDYFTHWMYVPEINE